LTILTQAKAQTAARLTPILLFSLFQHSHLKNNSAGVMKRILVLDDDEDILYVVDKILSDAGFHIHSTTYGDGLIELAEKFDPGLILLDYMLADGNGGDICRSLKLHQSLGNTPVIMFSAYTNPRVKFEDFGCDHFIAKPFDLSDLVTQVNKYLHPAVLQ
jgi:DNA-binding response OmpR family regulator